MTMTTYSHGTLAAVVLAGLACITAPGAAHAQDAAIEGAVTDATGLALPGVTADDHHLLGELDRQLDGEGDGRCGPDLHAAAHGLVEARAA